RRADQDHVSEASCDHLHPPQHEGAQDDVAQLRVRLNELEQMIAIDLDGFAGASCACSEERGTSAERTELAGELTPPVNPEQCIATVGLPYDLELTAHHQKKARDAITGADENLAGTHAARLTAATDPRDLLREQRRVCVL